MNDYMMTLGLMLCIFVLPAVLIYSYIRPARFNIRSAKNPTGGNSRAAFLGGMLTAWVASAVLVWQFYEPALSEEERLAIVREVAAKMNCNGLIEQDTLIGSIYTATRGVYESNKVNEKPDLQLRV